VIRSNSKVLLEKRPSAASLPEGAHFQRLVVALLGLAQTAELEAGGGTPKQRALARGEKSKGKAEATAASAKHAALDELRRFTSDLDAATIAKLIVLTSAGRDAKSIAESFAPASKAGEPAPEIFKAGEAWAEHLKRGLAIAHATDFDLETTVSDWAAKGRPSKSLEDRVWLRFGRELARSASSDWTCLGDVSAGDVLEKVYLRRGDGPWWSFGAWLDRPSRHEVTRLRGQRGKGRRKLATFPIEAVVAHRCARDRAALRRAARAMNVRFGSQRSSA
jgi:hypothetical protein